MEKMASHMSQGEFSGRGYLIWTLESQHPEAFYLLTNSWKEDSVLRDTQCCKFRRNTSCTAHHFEKASLNGAYSHRNCIRLTQIIVGTIWLHAEWSETQEQERRDREVPEDPLSLVWPAELSTAQETVT